MIFVANYYYFGSSEILIRVIPADHDEQIKLTRRLEVGAGMCLALKTTDEPRDVQTSKRTGSSRAMLSAGSAMAMEVKRKKIRKGTLFQQTEVVTRSRSVPK